MKIPFLFLLPRVVIMTIVIVLVVLATSCSSDTDPQVPPQVNTISPLSGPINTAVTISGSNFSTVIGENKVTFNGKDAVVTTATATQLIATVPLTAATGPVAIIVKGLAAANQPIFSVFSVPEINNISPSSAYVNTSVVITGSNFSTVLAENKVTFNGKEAVVTLATVTQLTATVPALAETGPIVVTVKGQTATNQPVFTVQVDKIKLALSTSLATYDAAVPNSWIQITAAEYSNLLIVVSGSARHAMPESTMNISISSSDGDLSAGVTVGGNSKAEKIPPSSYIIAWSIRTGTKATSSLNSKLKISASQSSGYIDYGNPLPDIAFKNSRVFFVLKTPNTITPATLSYTAVYMGIESFLGIRISSDSGQEHLGNGDSPTLGSSSYRDSFSQVISTQTKQW